MVGYMGECGRTHVLFDVEVGIGQICILLHGVRVIPMLGVFCDFFFTLKLWSQVGYKPKRTRRLRQGIEVLIFYAL